MPLVAIYPRRARSSPTARSSSSTPSGSTPSEKAAAALFEDFVQQPENQAKVLEFGFRPNNPTVPLADPIVAANGVDPTQPTAELEVPVARGAGRHPRLVGRAAQGGPRPARARHLGLDGRAGHRRRRPSSTSPRRPRSAPSTSSRTTDEVGLWVFSTDLGGDRPELPRARADRRRSASNRDALADADRGPVPAPTARRCTTSRRRRTTTMLESYDPAKINAIVLLTDGENDDGDLGDDDQQFDDLDRPSCSRAARASSSQPVRAVHDLLRRRRRLADAAGDLARRRSAAHLQRQQPGHHRPGVHRRDPNF